MTALTTAPGRYLLRWLAVVAIVGVLFVVGTAAYTALARRVHVVTYQVGPAQGPLSPDELERTVQVLSARLDALKRDFRLTRPSVRALPPDRVEVRFKTARQEGLDQALAWLAMQGRAEFRLLHLRQEVPAAGEADSPPEGYEVKVYRAQQYVLSRPGELETVRTSYLVERRPALVLGQPVRVDIETTGLHKMAVVTLRFGEADAQAFAALTALQVGRKMAMLVDGEMFLPPREVEGAVTAGAVQTSGYFYMPPLRRLAAMLNAGALPAPLEQTGHAVQ